MVLGKVYGTTQHAISSGWELLVWPYGSHQRCLVKTLASTLRQLNLTVIHETLVPHASVLCSVRYSGRVPSSQPSCKEPSIPSRSPALAEEEAGDAAQARQDS